MFPLKWENLQGGTARLFGTSLIAGEIQGRLAVPLVGAEAKLSQATS